MDVGALIAVQAESFERAQGGLRSSWPSSSAMAEAELGSFLSAHSYCVMATATSRGYPIARPVAFTVVGASFWFATVAGARLRNLERTPRASVVVSEGDADEHRAVAIDGPVEVVEQPVEEMLTAWATRHGSVPDWAAAWFELRPTRLVSYSARRTS